MTAVTRTSAGSIRASRRTSHAGSRSSGRSADATCPVACTPASVRPATVSMTGPRSTAVSAPIRTPATVRRPGWTAQPEKSVPS